MTDNGDTMPERTAAIREAASQIAGLRSEIQRLTEATTLLATKEDLKDERKVRRRWFIGLGAAATVMILMLGGLGFVALAASRQADFNGKATVVAAAQAEESAKQAKKIKRIAHQIRRTNDILIECTTPSTKNDVHECQEQSLAGQQATIGQTNAVTMASAYCAVQQVSEGTVTLSDVRSCVRRALGGTLGDGSLG